MNSFLKALLCSYHGVAIESLQGEQYRTLADFEKRIGSGKRNISQDLLRGHYRISLVVELGRGSPKPRLHDIEIQAMPRFADRLLFDDWKNWNAPTNRIVKVKFVCNDNERCNVVLHDLQIIAINGLEWLGNTYSCFCCKDFSDWCYFVEIQPGSSFPSSYDIVSSLFPASLSLPISKLGSRLSLLMSGSISNSVFSSGTMKIFVCQDISSTGLHPICVTDGCGFVSIDIAKQLIQNSEQQIQRNSLPTVFQVRVISLYGIFKGSLLILNGLPPQTMCIRPSMIKVTGSIAIPSCNLTLHYQPPKGNNRPNANLSFYSFEFSRSQTCNTSFLIDVEILRRNGQWPLHRLPKYVTFMLVHMGVPSSHFQQLINKEFYVLSNALRDPISAKNLIDLREKPDFKIDSYPEAEEIGCDVASGTTVKYEQLLQSMVSFPNFLNEEPFLRMSLAQTIYNRVEHLLDLSIPCGGCGMYWGLPDPFDCLQFHEVAIFLGGTESKWAKEGVDCLVTRFPVTRLSNIKLFRIAQPYILVDYFHSLCHQGYRSLEGGVIFFSTKGISTHHCTDENIPFCSKYHCCQEYDSINYRGTEKDCDSDVDENCCDIENNCHHFYPSKSSSMCCSCFDSSVGAMKGDFDGDQYWVCEDPQLVGYVGDYFTLRASDMITQARNCHSDDRDSDAILNLKFDLLSPFKTTESHLSFDVPDSPFVSANVERQDIGREYCSSGNVSNNVEEFKCHSSLMHISGCWTVEKIALEAIQHSMTPSYVSQGWFRWLQKADQNGPYDNLARKYSTQYCALLESRKHGSNLSFLHKNNSPILYPHYLQKSKGSSFHSSSILGQLFDTIMVMKNSLEHQQELKYLYINAVSHSSGEKNYLVRSPVTFDHDMKIVGAENFLDVAMMVCNCFEQDISKLSFSNSKGADTRKLGPPTYEKFLLQITHRYRRMLFDMFSTQSSSNVHEVYASALYEVSYSLANNLVASSSYSKRLKYLQIPWLLLGDILFCIKLKKLGHVIEPNIDVSFWRNIDCTEALDFAVSTLLQVDRLAAMFAISVKALNGWQ